MAIKRLVQAGLAIAAAAASMAGDALALPCGMTAAPAGAPTINYQPFNPTALGTTSVTITFTRVNQPGGEHTSKVRFYVKANSAVANGTSIVPISSVPSNAITGANNNIFYDYGAPPPSLFGNPSAGNRFLLIETPGNGSPHDVIQVTFNVTLPVNLDLAASTHLDFDIDYTCESNGGDNTPGSGVNPNALSLPIQVLSALQGSLVGAALDFGEIGSLTSATVLGAPLTYTRAANVRVASSGPFEVTLSSQNGFRMTYPGGNLTDPSQRLDYSIRFLGQDRTAGSLSAIAAPCQRASLGGQMLPIRVVLQEGGYGKVPAPNYSDLLTVTLTPQVTLPSPSNCGALF